MDEEWRVRLVPGSQSALWPSAWADAVRETLHGRSGGTVSVTGGKAGIFLYAATADAAMAAAAMAREVLAQQGLTADIRVERWDPPGQEWLPPGEAAAADPPSERERGPGRRRLRRVGSLIEAVIDAIGSVP